MTNEEIKYCKDCKKNNCGNILCRAKVNCIKELEKENDRLKAEIDNLQADKNALAHNVVMLGNIIREKEDLWGELEKRFVTVEKVCTEEEKAKCIMFPDYCEGSCKERIDLVALLEKSVDNGNIS